MGLGLRLRLRGGNRARLGLGFRLGDWAGNGFWRRLGLGFRLGDGAGCGLRLRWRYRCGWGCCRRLGIRTRRCPLGGFQIGGAIGAHGSLGYRIASGTVGGVWGWGIIQFRLGRIHNFNRGWLLGFGEF